MVEDISAEWEKRSRLCGTSLQGVLLKGLPLTLNEHIHNWHSGFVVPTLPEDKESTILDVGCGFGRLSKAIKAHNPRAKLVGIDLSASYIESYREITEGHGFVWAVEDYCDHLHNCDYIVCVTVLMYLDHVDVDRAVSNFNRYLNSNGCVICIEPNRTGLKYQTLFGLIPLIRSISKKSGLNTGGRYFKPDEIESTFANNGFRLIRKERMPATSIFLVPAAIVGKLFPKSIHLAIYSLLAYLDRLMKRTNLPSIYEAYVFEKISDSGSSR